MGVYRHSLMETPMRETENGVVISMYNAAYIRGLGVMIDLGVVEDMYEDAAGYFTIGVCIGWGQSIGTGTAISKTLQIEDFFGFSQGFSFSFPLKVSTIYLEEKFLAIILLEPKGMIM